MSNNRREHPRDKIILDKFDGAFFVETQRGEKSQFHCIHDLSISGVGLESPILLDPEGTIALTMDEGDFSVTVLANVAWCQPYTTDSGATAYRAGVRFSAQSKDNNMLFFMALRRYVDTFGQL